MGNEELALLKKEVDSIQIQLAKEWILLRINGHFKKWE